MMESSVRSKISCASRECSQSLVAIFSMTGCARHGHAAATSRFGVRSALPGVQSSTYRTKGLSFEHGNLDPSAEPAKLGEPTSPAMSGPNAMLYPNSDVVVNVRSAPGAGFPELAAVIR